MNNASRDRDHDDKAFGRFLTLHKRDLQRISRHTRGEETLESVQSEVWMTIHDFASRGEKIDLDLAEHRSRVIAHVYQKLVRYTEVHIRNAIRLDHAVGGDDESAAHPLMNRLAADEQYDPAVALTRREEEVERSRDDVLNPNRSLAGAYLDLLGRFGNQMSNVAGHLMISLSYCYRRCAQARQLATCQQCLPATCVREDTAFVPGPWRRFRVVREPVQLCFEFDEHDGLFLEMDG